MVLCFHLNLCVPLLHPQKVMACRRELVEYDQQQREVVAAKGQVPVPLGPKPKLSDLESKRIKPGSMTKDKKEG